jgi:CheY-like chemotaxis protein
VTHTNVGGLADNGWTALIVEPSSEVQSSMARQLEAQGFRVAAALESPEQIAKEAQAHTPDLLVLHLGENGGRPHPAGTAGRGQ